MEKKASDALFSPAIKATQEKLGSRAFIQKKEEAGFWNEVLSNEQMHFLSKRTSFYLGTASQSAEPYIQHRGGSEGFIQLTDHSSFWFPDFPGNRQYITLGNLSENPSAFAFFMDYPNRRRLKLWGKAFVSVPDEQQVEAIKNISTSAIKHIIRFDIEAVDENCPKDIIPRYTAEEYSQKKSES